MLFWKVGRQTSSRSCLRVLGPASESHPSFFDVDSRVRISDFSHGVYGA